MTRSDSNRRSHMRVAWLRSSLLPVLPLISDDVAVGVFLDRSVSRTTHAAAQHREGERHGGARASTLARGECSCPAAGRCTSAARTLLRCCHQSNRTSRTRLSSHHSCCDGAIHHYWHPYLASLPRRSHQPAASLLLR